ncbi:MAG: 50S ribosomal protein L18 [Chloroflexi bacterium]|nr:50S ribosomal protein L18 [Chloroflexota bacterium]
MFKPVDTRGARRRRHAHIRKQVSGQPSRPRLCVYRSLNHLYAQVIDDTRSVTLAAASTVDPALRSRPGSKTEQAQAVGGAIAERAIAAGVTRVVFDRGGYLYHGRVKALADAARAGGLEF